MYENPEEAMNIPIKVEELRDDVLDYAAKRSGRIYAPIDHPAFSDIPAHHGPERLELIRRSLPETTRTVLDIGSHWGYFANGLEAAGFTVTAAENNPEYLDFLYRIRALQGHRFTVFAHSIFEMEAPRFDAVLALNIFHHFIKDEATFGQFEAFLGRLECKAMMFQAHAPGEGQMANAYRNYSPEEFVRFLSEAADLPVVEVIGQFGSRLMYRLT